MLVRFGCGVRVLQQSSPCCAERKPHAEPALIHCALMPAGEIPQGRPIQRRRVGAEIRLNPGRPGAQGGEAEPVHGRPWPSETLVPIEISSAAERDCPACGSFVHRAVGRLSKMASQKRIRSSMAAVAALTASSHFLGSSPHRRSIMRRASCPWCPPSMAMCRSR